MVRHVDCIFLQFALCDILIHTVGLDSLTIFIFRYSYTHDNMSDLTIPTDYSVLYL